MGLLIGDNFNYQANKPNFERDSFATLAAMKAYPETSIDDGHISYCAETDKHYKFLSSNSVDATTGKWREFNSGSNSGGYIIDYITEQSGSITKTQYNEIVNAINNNIPIYVSLSDGFTCISTYMHYTVGNNIHLLLYIENIIRALTISTDYTYTIDYAELILNPKVGTRGQVLKKTSSGVEWANDNDTTYNKATQQADGLMSKEDKTKLDNITTAYASIMTQAEYDELSPKEENRIYYIKG